MAASRAWWLAGLACWIGCGSSPPRAKTPPPAPRAAAGTQDPDGPHRAAITAILQPLVDHQIVSSLVVGLYDNGKLEIYGFGKGPGGAAPTGHTLFELGPVTKVYTSLLLADAVQRREVELSTPLVDLVPPGVTVPVKDKLIITLGHLAVHSSGLPNLPPSLAARANTPDPYAGYGEDALYADLVQTQLERAPGEQFVYSTFGAGVLGLALGRKLGVGYLRAVQERVLAPLHLAETFFAVPPALAGRAAAGTNDDLVATPPWHYQALAGAGALISSVHDQLALVGDELEAAAGSKDPLRPAMRLTQEEQLTAASDDAQRLGGNEGLGWLIDSSGRYWHSGGTGGFRSYLGFDPRTKHGIVVLASTAVSVIDHLADPLYKVLAGEQVKPQGFPSAAQLATYAGKYKLDPNTITVTVEGQRLYIDGPGTPRYRLVPVSADELWIEELQSIVVFEHASPRDDGSPIVRARFFVGTTQFTAAREP